MKIVGGEGNRLVRIFRIAYRIFLGGGGGVLPNTVIDFEEILDVLGHVYTETLPTNTQTFIAFCSPFSCCLHETP